MKLPIFSILSLLSFSSLQVSVNGKPLACWGKVGVCHCPIGWEGKGCSSIDVNCNAVEEHMSNNQYDYLG